MRKVSNDGYISFNGSFYPVPMNLCLRDVMVEGILGRTLRVYDLKGNLVTEHEIRLFEEGIKPSILNTKIKTMNT